MTASTIAVLVTVVVICICVMVESHGFRRGYNEGCATQRRLSGEPPAAAATAPSTVTATSPVGDPGKQALEMLKRGDNCDWYSIDHNSCEMHEAFDALEIYWRTEVEKPEENRFGFGRGPFESKAGFRVRWRVAATNHSYVEAYGMDLMETILKARADADRLIERRDAMLAMGGEHPLLEVWKANGAKRKYDFHGLDLEEWHVSLEYPGGRSWAQHADLDQAAHDALAKAPA